MGLMTATTGVRAATPRVTVLDAEQAPADPWAVAQLRAGLWDADLAGAGDRPARLPPEVATWRCLRASPSRREGTIRPTLTSASVNCGMALVTLDVERPTERRDRGLLPARARVHPFPPTYRRDLTREEVVRCAAEGVAFAVDRGSASTRTRTRASRGGRHGSTSSRSAASSASGASCRWSVKQLSRIRFGTIGPSNHFIELQEVEEVFDDDAAGAARTRTSARVTLQYHGGGGSLPGELGLLYGRRKRYPRPVRLQMAVQKPLYHLATARSCERAEAAAAPVLLRATIRRSSVDGRRGTSACCSPTRWR